MKKILFFVFLILLGCGETKIAQYTIDYNEIKEGDTIRWVINDSVEIFDDHVLAYIIDDRNLWVISIYNVPGSGDVVRKEKLVHTAAPGYKIEVNSFRE